MNQIIKSNYPNEKNLLLFVNVIGLLTTNSICAAQFHSNTLYSHWIINSCVGDLRNKSVTTHFKTVTTERNIEWDYVQV